MKKITQSLIVKIPKRDQFVVPSKQWAWLDRVSGGLLIEAKNRGFLGPFFDKSIENPVWVLSPALGEITKIVLCHEVSEDLKPVLDSDSDWSFVGEWTQADLKKLKSWSSSALSRSELPMSARI